MITEGNFSFGNFLFKNPVIYFLPVTYCCAHSGSHFRRLSMPLKIPNLKGKKIIYASSPGLNPAELNSDFIFPRFKSTASRSNSHLETTRLVKGLNGLCSKTAVIPPGFNTRYISFVKFSHISGGT